MINNWRKNQYGVKHCADTYRTIDGERYIQWTDQTGNGTLEQAKQYLTLEKKEFPNHTFKLIKIDKQFYRIYVLATDI